MRYKWQKIKVLSADLFPHLEGKFVWARNQPPVLTSHFDKDGREFFSLDPIVVLNLEPFTPQATSVGLINPRVERHAEFAASVRIVKKKTWTNPKWKGAKKPVEVSV